MRSPAHLGVDFGTSHTVAVLQRDSAVIPLLFDSSPVLPSAIYAEPGTGLLVGADAVNAARLEPARFEPNPKRRVDDGRVLLGDIEFGVEELFAAVLARVRQEAERVLGALPARVTLTHPASWGSARRLVVEDAAAVAGFAGCQLLPEPVAAANYFSHVLRLQIPPGWGVVVADLGGGTFDASVVAATGAGFEVLAVDGSEQLGGVDLDHALMMLLTERFGDNPKWESLVNPQTTGDRRLLRGLYEDLRSAKERLSRHSRVDLPLPLVASDTHITREELEKIARPLLEKAVRITQAVIRASRLPQERVAGVFLVGGASRMPLVASMLHQALGTAPTVLEQPELVVAQGATLTAPVPDCRVTPAPVTPPSIIEPLTPPATPPTQPATRIPAVTEPPPRTPDRMTTAVQVSRILMWIHAGIGILWIPVLIYALISIDQLHGSLVVDYSEPYAAQFLVELLPIAIAMAAFGLGFAAWRCMTRRRMVRQLAIGANAIVAVVYSILAIVLSDSQGELIEWDLLLVVPVIGAIPLAVSCVVLLNTGSALRWFNIPPPPTTTLKLPLPRPVRTARVLMWLHTGFGMLWIVNLTIGLANSGTFAHDSDRAYPSIEVNYALVVSLVCLPVATVLGIAAMAAAVVRLKNRDHQARTLAFGVNTAILVVYMFSILGAAQADIDEPVTNTSIVVGVLGVLSITAAILLSTSKAHQWFTAIDTDPSASS